MSVIATALKHMLAAGMPHDAIIAAVAEMEASLPTVAPDPVDTRSKGAIRQERYRAKQKAAEAEVGDAHVTLSDAPLRDVTLSDGRDDAPPSPAPSLFLPPDPQPKPTPTHTPATETRARKGTRLAEDWEPEPLNAEHAAMVAKWPPGAFVREREKFRNYWLSKSGAGATKTNWQRTWINWLLSADERMPRDGSGNLNQSGNGFARPGSRSAEMDEAMDYFGFGEPVHGGMGRGPS